MVTTMRWWTAADLKGIPDDGCRYEALDGELLVTPAPVFGHRDITGRLVGLLFEYCRSHALGAVVVPGVVRWMTNELQPDVAVSTPGSSDESPKEGDNPLLVIEVHSPSTQQRDRGVKRAAYIALRIPEYWQISIEEQCVLVNKPGKNEVRCTSVLEWHPIPDIPPLLIDLNTLFR